VKRNLNSEPTKWGKLPGHIIFQGITNACVPKVPKKYEKIKMQ
jgi:hypothetical protein